ncbi:small integral membrane protein 30-like [Chanodichthys erythropterus]|uniref:small integral membrane protein 30-like n=1 Tax=Chanodichthys erythropterus TaxID=933992 RepID=UPI00351F7DA3
MTNNMAPKDQNTHMMLCLFLLTIVQTAEAFDGGDAAALLLGATVSLVGICACLGWYARTRNGQF